MKILIVCKSLPHRVAGGIQTHTWKMSEWLVRLGHEVSILTAGSFRQPIKRYALDGRNILEIPYFPGRKLPYFKVLAEEMGFNVAASRWIRAHKTDFDIVHLQGRSGFLFPSAQSKVPVVTTFHGLISVENARIGVKRRFDLGTWLHECVATYFEKKSMRFSDINIAVSREMALEMRHLSPKWGNKVQILPNGVDLPPSPKSLENESNLLVFVGRLERIKGVFPLIEAMKQVPTRIHLTMIGEGSERAEIEQQIAAAGLQSRIRLLGAQPSEVVFEHLHRAAALVLPSFHETQGIVLLEANACGKPVVASDIPGIREVVTNGENGLLTPVGDPKKLAACIAEMFENPVAAARMGEAGCVIVREKFAWEKIALCTERLYGNLLAEKSQRISSPVKKPVFARSHHLKTSFPV